MGEKTHFSESMNKVKEGANSFVRAMPKNEIGENSTVSVEDDQMPSLIFRDHLSFGQTIHFSHPEPS
jgi:hypothetical protein